MEHNEPTFKSERIYEGKVIKVRVDTVELPDKKYSKREIVEHPGAVGVVGITEENKVIFVRQYRKALEQFLLEIPAGKIELKENPEDCALRELKEETGYECESIHFLSKAYTSPGFSNEEIHIYHARGLKKGVATPDEDEYIETIEIPLDIAIKMINDGEIQDSKSIIGILMAKENQ